MKPVKSDEGIKSMILCTLTPQGMPHHRGYLMSVPALFSWQIRVHQCHILSIWKNLYKPRHIHRTMLRLGFKIYIGFRV